MTVPTLTLAHGARMPQIGLGTSPMDDAATERAVAQALELGYRLVDTAENYGNEEGVGRGVVASGVPREQVFVTTKFNKRWHGVKEARVACERSLERLGLDYLDLLLIHWPNPGQDRYVDAFAGLIELRENGLIRAAGTSNFKPAHIDRVIAETGQAPEVNQIQLNPLVSREGPRAYDSARDIVTESWSPFGGGGAEVLRHPTVVEVAERVGRLPAQVVLRWNVQLGLVAIPKSSDPGRLEANLMVFDFELSAPDMAALSALDQGEESATDSDVFGH
jgi:2,5-diketo-D-gluconate reductase A